MIFSGQFVRRSCVLVGVPALLLTSAPAESAPAGAIVVRLEDGVGAGRCIAATDRLSVSLRRIVVEKKSKWLGFIEDQDLALTFTTRLSGSSGSENKNAAFAKVVKQQVQSSGTGMISLANEQSLLSQFPLTTAESRITSVDLEVGLVRTSGKSQSARILLGAIATTQGLSLPANPFSPGLSVATSYVDGLFKPLLESAAAEKEAVTHNIMMAISPSNCVDGSDDERTGTKAIIDASADLGKPGIIDTSRSDRYCFRAELKPVFLLKAATKPASGNCDQAKDFTPIQNSHMAFFVNALPAATPAPIPGAAAILAGRPKSTKSMQLSGVLNQMGMSASTADTFSMALLSSTHSGDTAKALRVEPEAIDGFQDAIARCDANGLSIDQCLGRPPEALN